MPDSLIEIRDYALWGLTSINELVIPPLVTKIGRSSLRNMPKLETLIAKPINPPSMATDDNPLTNTNNIKMIYVPSDSINAYKTADIWKDYASLMMPFPSNVEKK